MHYTYLTTIKGIDYYGDDLGEIRSITNDITRHLMKRFPKRELKDVRSRNVVSTPGYRFSPSETGPVTPEPVYTHFSLDYIIGNAYFGHSPVTGQWLRYQPLTRDDAAIARPEPSSSMVPLIRGGRARVTPVDEADLTIDIPELKQPDEVHPYQTSPPPPRT